MMDDRSRLGLQRVKHIVSSYQLAGDEAEAFDCYLEEILEVYPTPLIELAFVETLLEHWVSVPLVRGIQFLRQAHQRLNCWAVNPITSTLSPTDFQLITGLNPYPVFGASETVQKFPAWADPG
jgi:hypothetical protein